MTIDVMPVNDAPTIVDGQNFSIKENAAPGDSAGKVKASDPDSVLTYSIIPASNANAFSITSDSNVSISAITTADGSDVFAINSSTGKITVVGPLDFESVSAYTLTVEVSDGAASSRSDITINITDVAEPEPPAAEEDAPLASRSLTDGTEQTSSTYTGSSTSGSEGYYTDWDNADDHESNDLEYVREAVTDKDAVLENISR